MHKIKNFFQINISCEKVGIIVKREFQNYFNTPIGYIFLVIFCSVMNFFFFYLGLFWETSVASMESFFTFLRLCYIFFIPAITMRLWAEEKKSGTVEMLLTLSLKDTEIVLGKFLSAVLFLCVALAGTLFLPITLMIVGTPDISLILGGYIGAILLGSAYIALGLLISWLTKDQIIAFMITLFSLFIIFIMGYPPFLRIVGSTMAPFFEFLSISSHFDSLSRGVFDSRDIFYFLSFIFIMLYLNIRSIENNR